MPPIFFGKALAQRLALHARSGLALELRFERIAGRGQFVTQFQPGLPMRGIQIAGFQRRAHGATGFVAVAAIAEAAIQCQRLRFSISMT